MEKWISKEYMKDLVSVIVPCYNRAQLIVETLDSVWNLTYRPIELIIVDDGSNDGTGKAIREWGDRKMNEGRADVIIRTIRQENKGPSMARNTGLLACNGEYIQFVDSDDILHKEKAEIQVEAINKHKKDFCVCNYMQFTKSIDDGRSVVDFYSRSHSIEEFPLVYPMDTPAPLYRRSVIADAGPWNTGIRSGEDFEYNFRVLCRGATGIWVNRALVYVRKHQNEERIQATALRERYRFMYHGLGEMEMEAREQGLCSKKLLRNLGLRALMYFEHMRYESDAGLEEIFFKYARSRVPFWRIIVFFLQKRIWKPLWRIAYPAGPRALVRRFIKGF